MIYKNLLYKKFQNIQNKLRAWVISHYIQIAIFNGILLLLVLLRSAGYFHPILDLSINLIVFIAIFLAIIFFRADSRIILLISVLFLILSIPFKFTSILEVWAERTTIYAFEAMILGFIMLIIENTLNRDE